MNADTGNRSEFIQNCWVINQNDYDVCKESVAGVEAKDKDLRWLYKLQVYNKALLTKDYEGALI